MSKDEWHSHSEFEGTLHILQLTSTQAQYEQLFLGAHSSMIKAASLKCLHEEMIHGMKYEEMTDSAKFVRVQKNVLHLITCNQMGQES